GGHIIDFAVPMEFSKVRIGALYLGFSDRSIRQTIATAREQTLWITGLMILAGIGGAVGLAIVLTKPILKLAQGTKAIAAGSFDITLPVTSRDEIGDLTESFNEMAKSLHEKEKIKRAFSSYVARQVVDEILKHPDEYTFTGERRNVTVIFCDMRGFTPLTERLPPEEVVAALNDFYSLMIDLTIKNEGYLNKFLGDAVMAIFGAPTAYPDHCMKAVKTALAMQAAVAELSARRVAEGKEAMSIGIGISAGEAVAGSVGTEFQTEYTVIGDRVNLAARLESNAKPGQILVSEETYRQVADKVIANCLGPMSVKGKEEPVTVFEISGLAAYTRGRDEAAQKIPVAKAGGAGRGGGLSRRLRRGDANSDHAGGGRQIRLREFRIAGLLRGDRQGGRHGGEPGRALSRRQEPGLDDRRLRRRRADCAGPPGGDPEKT